MKTSDLKNNFAYYLLLVFCALLPFQFALNPAPDIDLAIVRVFIPLLFLGWLAFAIKDKQQPLKLDKLSLLFVLYLFLAVLSLFFAQNFSWAIRKLLFLFSTAPIFFVAVSVLKTLQKQRTALTMLIFGASTLAVVAILQFTSQFVFGIDPIYNFLATHVSPFFLGQSFSKTVLTYPSWLVNAGGITYMRATAMFPDPHMLSYYLGLLLPWSIALGASAKKHRLWFAAAAVLLATADIFTFTRGGYVALIAGGIVILPLVPRRTAIKIILGIALFVCLLAIVPSNPVGSRLISSFDAHEGSNVARLSNFQQALIIIKAHPFGVGIGNYSLAVDPNATYREPIYAHNLYLDTAAELGLPAMLVLIALLFSGFNNFWLASKKNSFYIAGAASIAIFSVHSLVENPFYSVHVFPLFLIIIAIASKSNSNEKTPNN